MARFYGSLKGSRGEATRCGTKSSGIDTHTRGWNLGIAVRGFESGGADHFVADVTGGSNGSLGRRECRPMLSMEVSEVELAGGERGIVATFHMPDGEAKTFTIGADGRVKSRTDRGHAAHADA